jgi:ubiquinone/menaquinone biosynthesis C-methylase UbiE
MDQHTVLQRVPELELKLFSDNQIKIDYQGTSYLVDFFGLRILDLFSTPNSLSSALGLLDPSISGTQDWIDFTRTVMMMYKAGILRDVQQQAPVHKPEPKGFDSAFIHIQMLNDQRRTRSYLEAISQVVKPGDVVLDIGTGTGILATAAAKTGARQVYAIEATSISSQAKQLFAQNQVQDRITLISGWSTQVSLPEQVDVLVSEIIGNDPFGERVLEATIDARKRFLKENARFLPDLVRVYALPLKVPSGLRSDYLYSSEMLENWYSWYGIDFSALLDTRLEDAYFLNINPMEARNWPVLCDPVFLLEIDLARVDTPLVECTVQSIVQSAGEIDGVLVYFELRLAPDIWFSVSPARADDKNSWRNLVWLLPAPVAVQPGDVVEINYRYNQPGIRDGVAVKKV